ncbi:T9SS type A sorting domain-containing protein [Lacibacter sediminis]|uniref:T9SS type A sorting domain-containing protein n=1 Tax=Lacibacter sediminis TaxID=2760713 RepID=A0A7G5XIV7_9BACT|nr:T9SS type A sorting domain-containing protein [Lacibacter sediminis]QNA45410.1 T9SS type A sorting domain-containing protein [Lacibacter sediminis]
MIRKLLLLLVVITILQNTSYSQGAEIYGNCFYRSTTETIVVRLALSNPTGSNQGQMRLMGMRFGFQYNADQVTYEGYYSYMTGLNDGSYLPFIGPDTQAGGADIDPNLFSGTGLRTAPILNPNGTSKIMTVRYINRSTADCDNGLGIPAGTTAILLDIFFKLKNPGVRPPSYYHLTDPDYGFGDPQFIAQFFDKQNGGHTASLTDSYKEIGVTAIREGNSNNPYQPFDISDCDNQNYNPITIGKDDVNFITPINGVLSGKAIDATVQDKDNHVLVNWKSEYNQLVDYFEVQRKEGNGEFKTIGLVMSKEGNEAVQYEFKDKITARDVEPSYRIKVINNDKIITYSDVKKIRLGSEQSISVKVFPNPSSENIRINLPAVENGSMFVCRMYSTEGRIVKVSNVSAANPSVDIRSLSVGSYFMELYNPKSGKRFYTQFSKQ